ncbi:MAG: WD40 repeat domain-containing protein [Flavobacteriales bacterium]
MARTTTLLLTLGLGIGTMAQSFDRVFSLLNDAPFNPMHQSRLNDGGTLICGVDWSVYNFHIVRVSPTGNVLWAMQVPSTPGQELFDVMASGEFANGDVFVMVDASINFVPERVLLRLGSAGDLLWVMHLDYGDGLLGNYTTRASHVAETSIGDIIVNVSAENRSVLTKLTPAGSLLWSKSFTTSVDTTYNKHPSFDMQVMSDDGVLLCGKDRDWPYLLRTNANGDMVWGRTYNVVYNYSHFRAMEVLPNGDVLLSGMHDGNGALMRIGASGSIQWLKHFDLGGYYQSLEALGDGTYLMCSESTCKILRVDGDGNLLNAFACGTGDLSAGLFCLSGAGGYAHMAGQVVDNTSWTSYNYLARFDIDTPPPCLFQPLTVEVIDVPSVVGAMGMSILEQLVEPVTVTPLTWTIFPSEWTSDVFCGVAETVSAAETGSVSISPTLLPTGGAVNVALASPVSAQAEWFAMSGALAKSATFTGQQATLGTDGLVPGLYTLRLSVAGTPVSSARIALQ